MGRDVLHIALLTVKQRKPGSSHPLLLIVRVFE